ncbi:nuclear transport factor 2 family protein [Candidatus Clostridium radicumherbarum]|uniref:Nuclear transport factor 2 family protein n=1 Tax=Candidatus Clostridium radicumherbarum TaxID=3381662 RepID=A0ABW8TXS5_9CLOT
MNNLETQILDNSPESYSEQKNMLNKSKEEYEEIRKVLMQFQSGYTNRDIEKIDAFVEELFVSEKDTYILGTGTGELFFGKEQIKTLIEDDWKYWGDVNIDLEKTHIDVENNVAWFYTTGSVKCTFEDTSERNNRYVDFIKSKVEEPELTPKQKITFINWVLALTYHQRLENKREYLLPLRLSGVLLKESNWKFAHLKFSLPKADFPDERFESSSEFLESYNNQNTIVDKCCDKNLSIELIALLKGLETELIHQKNISIETINKFFVAERTPYIVAPENKLYLGIDEIMDFFVVTSNSILSLDLEHAIYKESNDVLWITVCGTMKQSLTDDELAAKVLDDLGSLFHSNITSKEKLFVAHRSISYMLKESAVGVNYTCPIRLNAIILKQKQGLAFHNIHLSYPSYWVLEGKIDSI